MTSHMEADLARLLVKVWDLGPTEPDTDAFPKDSPEYKKWEKDRAAFDKGGPRQLEMRTFNARDAFKNDPNRYVLNLPRGVKPGPAQLELEERARAEATDLASIAARDPVFGTLGSGANQP